MLLPVAPRIRNYDHNMKSASDRWSRVFIISVSPRVHEGVWHIKRTVGERVNVTADIIVDGHDQLCAKLYVTHLGGATEEIRMTPTYNDEYTGSFVTETPGLYTYHVQAWIDRYGSWQEEYGRRFKAKMPESELKIELLDGAALLKEYAINARRTCTRWSFTVQTRFTRHEDDRHGYTRTGTRRDGTGAGDYSRPPIHRFPAALPQYTLGHVGRIKKIREITSSHSGLYLAGNYLDGVGIPDCIRNGMRVATRVIN
ncbi:MAG: DUF3416 domain-containing protein [Rhodothermaceae bacterium]|nr:DUF3416 domain-containing protein [Rhodothermaceae bacterium]MYI16307.1 DUF3416 domain-containing protein [Rhodothermaceae bacterium]